MRFVGGNMKFNKKALLGMLAAVSILPGCGKKNDTPAVAVGGPAAVTAIGSGQCLNISYNTAQYITFYGSLTQGYTGVVGQLSAYGYGSTSYGGSNYYRNLNTGDTVNVYVSAQTAYAVVYLSANTASAIVQGSNYGGAYNGSAQVCGLDINESVIAGGTTGPGYTGTMGGGYIRMWGNGRWITYDGYNPILF